MPVMRYMTVNKIHTHLYVGRYGVNTHPVDNAGAGNLVPAAGMRH